ncbi:hypothetical protein ABZW49_10455 [Nonomuraea wenchangensis]
MNVLSRVWRVYADPAKSEAASFLKVMIPIEVVCFAVRVTNDLLEWPPLFAGLVSGTTLTQVLLWYAMLAFVRQRDEARAELANHEKITSRSTVTR